MTGNRSFDIDNIAKLARLKISDSEKLKLQGDMNKIVSYIDQLSELDISGIEPTLHAADLKNVWREDTLENKSFKDKILANAPDNVDGELIKVPKILPSEEM